MQSLFAQSFSESQDKKNSDYYDKVLEIKSCISQIDPLIEKAAPQFPISKIAKIDAAILRLSVFELMFEKKEPEKVIIDESVELAKQFGGDKSPSFINGVLGNLMAKKIKTDSIS